MERRWEGKEQTYGRVFLIIDSAALLLFHEDKAVVGRDLCELALLTQTEARVMNAGKTSWRTLLWLYTVYISTLCATLYSITPYQPPPQCPRRG